MNSISLQINDMTNCHVNSIPIRKTKTRSIFVEFHCSNSKSKGTVRRVQKKVDAFIFFQKFKIKAAYLKKYFSKL